MKIMVRLFLIIVLLFIANGCKPSSEVNNETYTATNTTTAVIGTEIGNLAPDFQLQDIEGQNVTLSNLRGTPIILNFWASWCGPCEQEMPFLQQIYEDWHNEGVILLTINLRETLSVVTQYMQSKSLSFPVLFDTDGEVSLNYNIIGIPTTFFIDKDGIIQAKRLGPFNSAAEIESSISIIQS